MARTRKPASNADSSDLLLALALADYEQTIETRQASFSGVRVVRLRAKGGDDVIPEGSVVAYFPKKGSPVLDELAEAAQAGDMVVLRKIHERQTRAAERRIEGADPDKAKSISAVPRFAELRYGGKTISKAVYLPAPSTVEARIFAYNGGKLTPGQFRVAQYAENGRGAELDTVLVVRAPQLSALEKKILAAIPADQSEMNISTDMAFIGKIVRALVEGGKKIVRAVTKITTKTTAVNPQLITVGCPCPSGAFMVVATVNYTLKDVGKTPRTPLPLAIDSWEIKAGMTASELKNMRRDLLWKSLYDPHHPIDREE